MVVFQVALQDGGLFDLAAVDEAIEADPSVRLLHVQRSCGYRWRPSIPIYEIERYIGVLALGYILWNMIYRPKITKFLVATLHKSIILLPPSIPRDSFGVSEILLFLYSQEPLST